MGRLFDKKCAVWFLSPSSNDSNNATNVNNDGNLNNNNANNNSALRPDLYYLNT